MSCLNKSFMLLLFVVVSILPNKLVVSNKFNQKLTVSDSVYCDTISNIIDTNSIFKVNEGLLKGGLLYDVEKNKIIWGKNVQYHFEIASLTKMMVALIIIEDVRAGKINLNDRVKVPKEATLVGGSRVLLKSGSYQSIYNLLKASMIASGNDACYTLAYFGEASEKKFVDRMNIRAKRLNMNDTHFSNSTGMPARKGQKDNYSSPYDLLILSIELMKYTEILEISNMSKDNIHNGYRNITIHNHNRLVSKYSEFSGIKTGWTNKAGYCIVTKSDKSSKSLVCIVLGCSTSAIRNTIVTTLHNQYYEEIGINKLRD